MNRPTDEQYNQLPDELKASDQWCIAGPEKAPYYVGTGGVLHASLHRPDQWGSFKKILADANKTQAPGLGIMLTYEDPWTCIDLDVCNAETQRLKGEEINPDKWTTAEQLERYTSIVQQFDSYTEVSTLGWGLHIWVRGRIGAGARRDGVEVYSQERFIICTGDVYVNKPIANRQELLDNMVSQMRGPGYRGPVALVEVEEVENDMEVYDRALNAANRDKFDLLCRGLWRGDYPSQSEADLALLSMFCFYSPSNEQCRRLFRCTELGRREKAVKNDRYLNFTLEVIRGRQQREALINTQQIDLARDLVRSIQGTDFADVAAAQVASVEQAPVEVAGTISWPPGLAGALASFIYHSSPRPVKEVSIVAALGFLAGVCGKAFNIPQSGLNLYVILVARSGVGKEAMHSGLSLVCEELRESIPAAQKFIDFNDFASGPALTKACAAQPSFVNVAGEWGRKLKRIADERTDGPMTSLRTAMTNFYQKSAAGAMAGGITYSDKDKNISAVTGVAYSMIGETTPGTFYESLTASMMEDGFLSRFIIVDYEGERPDLNANPVRKMSTNLAQAIHGLCAQALTLISRFNSEMVTYGPEAAKTLQDYDRFCTNKINSTNDESIRQMWNRAHLKVCRVASLLAVADNWLQPVVTAQHVAWALELISRDIAIMSKKLSSGEIGVDDEARERKLLAVVKNYLEGAALGDAYKCPPAMQEKAVIPHRYLQIRLSRASQFLNTKEGASRAITNTVRLLIDNGYLQELEKNYLAENFNYHGKAYRVVSIPNV